MTFNICLGEHSMDWGKILCTCFPATIIPYHFPLLLLLHQHRTGHAWRRSTWTWTSFQQLDGEAEETPPPPSPHPMETVRLDNPFCLKYWAVRPKCCLGPIEIISICTVDLYTTSVWICVSAQINFIHCDHIWLFTQNLRNHNQPSLSCNQAFLCLVRAVLRFLFWILSPFLILSLQSPHQQRYVSSLVLELLWMQLFPKRRLSIVGSWSPLTVISQLFSRKSAAREQNKNKTWVGFNSAKAGGALYNVKWPTEEVYWIFVQRLIAGSIWGVDKTFLVVVVLPSSHVTGLC